MAGTGGKDDPRQIRYMSEDEKIIWAARTGFGGRGTPLTDREIIRHLTSDCYTDEQLYAAAQRFARHMGWGVEDFVKQAQRIARGG